MQMSRFEISETDIRPNPEDSKLFKLAAGYMDSESALDLLHRLAPFSFDRRRELLRHAELAEATSHASMILMASRKERVRVEVYRPTGDGSDPEDSSHIHLFQKYGDSIKELYNSTLSIHTQRSCAKAGDIEPRDEWEQLSLQCYPQTIQKTWARVDHSTRYTQETCKNHWEQLNRDHQKRAEHSASYIQEQVGRGLAIAVHDRLNNDHVKAMLLATPFEYLDKTRQDSWRKCLDDLSISQCTIGPDVDHDRKFVADEFVILRLFASPFSLQSEARPPHYKGVGRLMLRKAIEAVQDLDPILVQPKPDNHGAGYRRRIAAVSIPEGAEYARMRSLVESEGGWRVHSDHSAGKSAKVHPTDQRSVYIF